jgi:hypothetical protein
LCCFWWSPMLGRMRQSSISLSVSRSCGCGSLHRIKRRTNQNKRRCLLKTIKIGSSHDDDGQWWCCCRSTKESNIRVSPDGLGKSEGEEHFVFWETRLLFLPHVFGTFLRFLILTLISLDYLLLPSLWVWKSWRISL